MVIRELKAKAGENWKLEVVGNNKVQEMFTCDEELACVGDEDMRTFSAVNKLITGHSKLKFHMSKIGDAIDDKCNTYEDLNHYMFDCKTYT